MWEAQLSDGTLLDEYSPELQTIERSPWRELERLYPDQVVWARQNLGTRFVQVESEGYTLVCGMYFVDRRDLMSGSVVSRVYRFVVREEEDKWDWAIVGEQGAWRIIQIPPGVPGQEACPDPEALAAGGN